MRLFLQQRPDGREAPRFVQLQLEADLLGGWTLLRESGQIGGRSTLKREQYPTRPVPSAHSIGPRSPSSSAASNSCSRRADADAPR
jgi:hypothetical protein